MVGINKVFCLVPALPSPAAVGVGAERREKVAHGVSRGIGGQNRISPGGASENRSPFCHTFARFACSFICFAPAGAFCFWERCPTADAVGYHLAALRGCILAAVHPLE